MISFFHDAYPDELFYSMCARFSASLCYPRQETLPQVLFGEKHSTAVVDLPGHLGYFVDQLLPGHHYTVDSLIDKYTLLPYYQPFLPNERTLQIRHQMVTGPARGIQARVGRLSGKVTFSSVLRYCPACVVEERSELGECYWHRLHQLPGVVLCPHHDVFLEDSAVETTTASRHNSFLAAEESIPNTLPRSAKDAPFFQVFKQLALSVEDLLRTSLPSQSREFWRNQYTALMAQHGYVTPRGLLRCAEFFEMFVQAYPPELLRQLDFRIKLEVNDWTYWWAGLRGALRSVQHPLFHLLVLQVLGVSVTTFFHQRFAQPELFGSGPWPCLNPVCAFYLQPVITTFQVSTDWNSKRPVGRFACTCGFIYSRRGPDQRPEDQNKVLKIIVYGEVWEAVFRNCWEDPSISLKEMSRRLGVASSTITNQAKRLGLPVPRLSRYSNSSGNPRRRQDKGVDWYRQQWLAHLEAHPEATRSQLIRLLPGVHMWLISHDYVWLSQHLPPSIPLQGRKRKEFPGTRRPFFPVPRVQALEDAELAETVRTTVEQLRANAERPVRITKLLLMRMIPELKVITYAPDQFPLTTKEVTAYREANESIRLRRIRWAVQRFAAERVCPIRFQFETRAGVRGLRKLPVIHQAVDEALTSLEALRGQGWLETSV